MIQTRQDLTHAYHIISHLCLDDHTYTHLSARLPSKPGWMLTHQFGLNFAEVTTENLLEVSLDGANIKGVEKYHNATGYNLHGTVYQARADLNAVFHVHTPHIVAVSALAEGLLPISQWALHFYKRVQYYEYNSLVLECAQGSQIAASLKGDKILLLKNHGAILCGCTIPEALFYLYHLEQACRAQCLALSMKRELVMPPAEICERSAEDLLNFEKDLGQRDWESWIRLLKTDGIKPHYQNGRLPSF